MWNDRRLRSFGTEEKILFVRVGGGRELAVIYCLSNSTPSDDPAQICALFCRRQPAVWNDEQTRRQNDL